tara:strand:+ start:237 stop:1394 length:1158 start_codon:yes stop_codon:yes gene_type:complete
MKFPKLFSNDERENLKSFQKLSQKDRSIVFYTEHESYAKHFQNLISELTETRETQICYVTSSKTDPMLKSSHKNIRTYFIGDGITRTNFFINLRADILIMTMPDLETFHIKRSKVYDVHYVYIFHSMVSTHMIYRKNAFDNFDTIFCVGKHHIDEIRKNEKLYNLKTKNLIEYGYGKLETLIHEHKKMKNIYKNNKKSILIAPSWGPTGLIEMHGIYLLELLLSKNYHVVLRPHPMTIKKSSKLISEIEKTFQNNPDFILEYDMRISDSFFSSDCMISDWSGAALEYAFALKKPVLFVDVPKKINNSEYEKLEITPIEQKIRTKIGSLISPNELSDISHHLENLWQNYSLIEKNIENVRSHTVFNIQSSQKIGSKYILDLLENHS